MRRADLCDLLGVTETRLEEWITAGLPCTGERPDEEFEQAEVATWLYQTGRAEIDRDNVATNGDDASRRLGISRRTLTEWQHLPGFPGRSGYFPINDIMRWNEQRDKKVNQYATQSESDENKKRRPDLTIKEQRDLLKLQQERGELVEIDVVTGVLSRGVAFAKAELALIAGKVESRLPAELGDDLVRLIREQINRAVDEACTLISEMFTEATTGSDSDDEPS